MKTKIPETAYRNLTFAQRLNALFAAEGRNDTQEIQRLLNAKPEHAAPVTAKLDHLRAIAIAVEADVREALIGFFAVYGRNDELALDRLQVISDLRESWRLALLQEGIDPADFAKAGPPESAFFEVVAPMLPEPDRVKSCELARLMCK